MIAVTAGPVNDRQRALDNWAAIVCSRWRRSRDRQVVFANRTTLISDPLSIRVLACERHVQSKRSIVLTATVRVSVGLCVSAQEPKNYLTDNWCNSV